MNDFGKKTGEVSRNNKSVYAFLAVVVLLACLVTYVTLFGRQGPNATMDWFTTGIGVVLVLIGVWTLWSGWNSHVDFYEKGMVITGNRKVVELPYDEIQSFTWLRSRILFILSYEQCLIYSKADRIKPAAILNGLFLNNMGDSVRELEYTLFAEKE